MSTVKKQTTLSIVTKTGTVETTPEAIANLAKRLESKTYTEQNGDEKFWFCHVLQQQGQNLIKEKFAFIKEMALAVKFIFRAKATKRAAGKCTKLNDMYQLVAGVDFLIWVAWDVWAGLTEHQREALLFHELSHIGLDEDGNPALAHHDVEMFYQELTQYGAWHNGLLNLVETAKQLELFKEPAK